MEQFCQSDGRSEDTYNIKLIGLINSLWVAIEWHFGFSSYNIVLPSMVESVLVSRLLLCDGKPTGLLLEITRVLKGKLSE